MQTKISLFVLFVLLLSSLLSCELFQSNKTAQITMKNEDNNSSTYNVEVNGESKSLNKGTNDTWIIYWVDDYKKTIEIKLTRDAVVTIRKVALNDGTFNVYTINNDTFE